MIDKRKENYKVDIVYYDDSLVPSINIPQGKSAPSRLLMYLCYETSETEPGPGGIDVPIIDMELDQYFSYNYAKDILEPELLDKLRIAFGLEDLSKASNKGKKVLEKVNDNIIKSKGN